MTRLLLLIACFLMLGVPVQSQDVDAELARRIEELIEQLGDDGWDQRREAAWGLGDLGPHAAPAVPALITALADQLEVQIRVGQALIKIGGPAAPALIEALNNENADVRRISKFCLETITDRLKKQGTVLWWVVPRVYWKGLVGLLLFLVAWFGFATRNLERRAKGKLHLFALVATPPMFITCQSVYYAITRDWAQGFLPDSLTIVPFPVAAVLSTAFLCVLAAVWACARKPVEGAVEQSEASSTE